jgi:hypothetical protein
VPRYRGRNRKTCETVDASIVEAIPKRTSSVTHPEALRAEFAAAASAGIVSGI